MLHFYRLLLAGTLVGALAGCSPKLSQALTADELSAALPAGTPYALVHLYRPGRVVGFAVGYDVRLNDSVAYRARNASQGVVRHLKPGPVLLTAKTEAREQLTLDVQPGREYYVRCTLGMGALVGQPHLEQVGVVVGRKETAAIGSAPPPAGGN